MQTTAAPKAMETRAASRSPPVGPGAGAQWSAFSRSITGFDEESEERADEQRRDGLGGAKMAAQQDEALPHSLPRYAVSAVGSMHCQESRRRSCGPGN